MLTPRIALSVASLTVFCASVVACRVATQENDLYGGDDHVSSAQIPAALDDAGTAEVIDAGIDRDASDAAPDAPTDGAGDADAANAVAPPCTPQTMYASAPSTTCAADSITIAGGTISPGGYYLSRWADGAKWCASTSPRQGTMSIENVGGTLFMRWTLFFEGKTTWGTYELTPNTTTSFMRDEVCNWTPQTPATLVSYSASTSAISFFHENGQEHWTRIPKALPTPPPGSFDTF